MCKDDPPEVEAVVVGRRADGPPDTRSALNICAALAPDTTCQSLSIAE